LRRRLCDRRGPSAFTNHQTSPATSSRAPTRYARHLLFPSCCAKPKGKLFLSGSDPDLTRIYSSTWFRLASSFFCKNYRFYIFVHPCAILGYAIFIRIRCCILLAACECLCKFAISKVQLKVEIWSYFVAYLHSRDVLIVTSVITKQPFNC
jgi:hypothetical protein